MDSDERAMAVGIDHNRAMARPESELAARDVGPLERAQNHLRHVLSDLDGEIGMLSAQLTPLLQSAPESGAGGVPTREPEPPKSPVVTDLDEQVQRVHELIERVRGLRNYLDVR